MTNGWSNNETIGNGQIFTAMHIGLTVDLIATPRDALKTCSINETLKTVVQGNTDHYDFLPVVEAGAEKNHVVGLLHAACFRKDPVPEGSVATHFKPLSEKDLIGAGSSILDFIKTGDSNPCQLLVSKAGVDGLVSISDLQKLPVRAALFALITGFEITMAEAIRAKFPLDEDWLDLISEDRRHQIKAVIDKSRNVDGFVDALLFSQIVDKATIVRKRFELPWSAKTFKCKFKKITKLRNALAHANEYAATPDEARGVCATVRDILGLQQVLVDGVNLPIV